METSHINPTKYTKHLFTLSSIATYFNEAGVDSEAKYRESKERPLTGLQTSFSNSLLKDPANGVDTLLVMRICPSPTSFCRALQPKQKFILKNLRRKVFRGRSCSFTNCNVLGPLDRRLTGGGGSGWSAD